MLAHPRGGSSVDILTTDREEQFLKVIAWDLRDSGGRKDVDWTITVKEGEGALEEILRDKVGGSGNVVEHRGDHDLTFHGDRGRKFLGRGIDTFLIRLPGCICSRGIMKLHH